MLCKLAQVGWGEKVVINGHGDPDTLGDLTYTQLAALLAKGGLKGPVSIELIACETGWGGAPYALNLKVELVQAHKIMCAVSAPTHFISVLDDASLYVDEDVVDDTGAVTAVQTPPAKAFYATTKAF
jgi:hypothetical protein